MVAPFPYDAVSGAIQNPDEVQTYRLYVNFAWLARLTHEMDEETELDLKRVQQFVMHGAAYRAAYALLDAQGAAALPTMKGYFGMKGVEWVNNAALASDLADIDGDLATMLAWIDANEDDYKGGFSTNVMVAPNTMSDISIKKAKSVAVGNFLSAFRARWGARPT